MSETDACTVLVKQGATTAEAVGAEKRAPETVIDEVENKAFMRADWRIAWVATLAVPRMAPLNIVKDNLRHARQNGRSSVSGLCIISKL
jgi:hypothetical protein